MEVFAVLIRHLLLKRCELAALAVFRKLVLGSDEKRPGIFILALELGPFYPFHDPEYQAAGKDQHQDDHHDLLHGGKSSVIPLSSVFTVV